MYLHSHSCSLLKQYLILIILITISNERMRPFFVCSGTTFLSWEVMDRFEKKEILRKFIFRAQPCNINICHKQIYIPVVCHKREFRGKLHDLVQLSTRAELSISKLINIFLDSLHACRKENVMFLNISNIV